MTTQEVTELRKLLLMTKGELAHYLCTSEATISRVESGKVKISIHMECVMLGLKELIAEGHELMAPFFIPKPFRDMKAIEKSFEVIKQELGKRQMKRVHAKLKQQK